MGIGSRRRCLLKKCDGSLAQDKLIDTREELDSLQFNPLSALLPSYSSQIHGDEIESCAIAKSEFNYDFSVSESEVNALIEKCSATYDKTRLDDLLGECKTKVVEGIVVPFGLGGVLSHYDKEGGNVNTIHNVREGVYATEEEKNRYDNRGEYDSAAYHRHKKYREINRQAKEGDVLDAYTGETVKGKINLDHVVSAKTGHDDPGRVLAELSGSDLVNTESNLKFTNEHINKTKKDLSVKDYILYRQNKMANIQKQIDILENKAKAGSLSVNQKKSLDELKKAKERYQNDGFNENKAKEIDEKARSEINKKINLAYYCSTKFVGAVATTGAIEGLKMGWQQALGLALTEFFVGIIDEARDAFKNGFDIERSGFWKSLKRRFMRILKRVVARWRAALDAFKRGFLSGFLSNLVTVLINCLVRTGKNIVRMIREGIYSLVRAVNILMTRPNGMTLRESAHEATKIIASGLVVVGGIALAEWLDKMIVACPPLEVVSDVLVSIISGVVTGIASALIVYSIDKLDIFDVNARKKHDFIMKQLSDVIEFSLSDAEAVLMTITEDVAEIETSLKRINRCALDINRYNEQIKRIGDESVFL